MEDQIRNRIKELVAQRDQILGQINQNTTQSQQLEAAYQQTAGAIAGLYEFTPDVEGKNKFAPDAEGEDDGEVEAPAENGQPDLELAEAWYLYISDLQWTNVKLLTG